MIHVYIGFDARDTLAYRVAVRSLVENSSAPVEVHPLRDWELRRAGIYTRGYYVDGNGQRYDAKDSRPFSTDFSYARFLVPYIHKARGRDGWCMFTDPDVLFRADISELFALTDPGKSVMCVQHDYTPNDAKKMAGLTQTAYRRKNWSSVLLFNGDRDIPVTPKEVNDWHRDDLHGLRWLDDGAIGSLPEEWNWLEGWSPYPPSPKLVHYTRGTPDLPGYENVDYAGEWWSYTTASERKEAEAQV